MIYADQKTPFLYLENITASSVQAALNDLQPIKSRGFVLVTGEASSNSSMYKITFHMSNPTNTELLKIQAHDGIAVLITRIQKGD